MGNQTTLADNKKKSVNAFASDGSTYIYHGGKVEHPDDVEKITRVIISPSVTKIEREAFKYCHSLQTVKCFFVPATTTTATATDEETVELSSFLQEIGSYAFNKCRV